MPQDKKNKNALPPLPGGIKIASVVGVGKSGQRGTETERAVRRLMTQQDPRFPNIPYQGSPSADADSIKVGTKARKGVSADMSRKRLIGDLEDDVLNLADEIERGRYDKIEQDYIALSPNMLKAKKAALARKQARLDGLLLKEPKAGKTVKKDTLKLFE